MGTIDDAVVEIESLEKGLLSPENGNGEEDDETEVLYTASFQEMEDNFVKYQTLLWMLYSLLFVLAWGIGLLMFLYLPVRRYILRKDIRSRKLYVAPNSIVYKAVLDQLANVRTEALSRQVSLLDDTPTFRAGNPRAFGLSPSKSLKHDATAPSELALLQKLEEVGTSVKRLETLIEKQQYEASKPVD
uniref:Uncharacterized protein n=1 Tax=Opuntia streptacantha TaxID=393608 RepID=A0A7C9EZ24_OPUST